MGLPSSHLKPYPQQDSLYLEHYYRLRTEAVSKSGTLDEIKQVAAKLSKSLDWVISFRDDCTNKLGVPKSDVTSETPSQALKNSIALHDEVNKTGDWLECVVLWHRA
jgi:thiaminase